MVPHGCCHEDILVVVVLTRPHLFRVKLSIQCHSSAGLWVCVTATLDVSSLFLREGDRLGFPLGAAALNAQPVSEDVEVSQEAAEGVYFLLSGFTHCFCVMF